MLWITTFKEIMIDLICILLDVILKRIPNIC